MRAALLALVVLLVAVAPAHAATKHCGGVFRVTQDQGTFTTSVAVHNLRQSGTTCKTAKHVARVAAKALLNSDSGAIPAKIDGFTLTVPKTCAGCPPQYAITGRKGTATIRFKLYGGG